MSYTVNWNITIGLSRYFSIVILVLSILQPVPLLWALTDLL